VSSRLVPDPKTWSQSGLSGIATPHQEIIISRSEGDYFCRNHEGREDDQKGGSEWFLWVCNHLSLMLMLRRKTETLRRR